MISCLVNGELSAFVDAGDRGLPREVPVGGLVRDEGLELTAHARLPKSGRGARSTPGSVRDRLVAGCEGSISRRPVHSEGPRRTWRRTSGRRSS